MALQVQATLDDLNRVFAAQQQLSPVASYARLTELHIDVERARFTAVIAFYTSATARSEGRPPFAKLPVIVQDQPVTAGETPSLPFTALMNVVADEKGRKIKDVIFAPIYRWIKTVQVNDARFDLKTAQDVLTVEQADMSLKV